jgi:hypothetical protein
VDIKVDSLHVKRIVIKNLVSYIYIVRVDDQSINGMNQAVFVFFFSP